MPLPSVSMLCLCFAKRRSTSLYLALPLPCLSVLLSAVALRWVATRCHCTAVHLIATPLPLLCLSSHCLASPCLSGATPCAAVVLDFTANHSLCCTLLRTFLCCFSLCFAVAWHFFAFLYLCNSMQSFSGAFRCFAMPPRCGAIRTMPFLRESGPSMPCRRGQLRIW